MEIELKDDGALEERLSALKVSLGVADVSDCFHRLRFGSALATLKKYFCYPPLEAAELGIEVWTVRQCHLGTLFTPWPIAFQWGGVGHFTSPSTSIHFNLPRR